MCAECSKEDGPKKLAPLFRAPSVTEALPLVIEGVSGEVATAAMEDSAGSFGDRMDIGTITVACAIAYLDFRFSEKLWRESHKALAKWFETMTERPSISGTVPPE